MLDFLAKLFPRVPTVPSLIGEATPARVVFDENSISVTDADGISRTLAWSDIESVMVLTTSGGPFVCDLTWVVSGRSGRAELSVPMGTSGEHEFLKAMQSRLHGFDNMTVVEAMGSTEDAVFLVWQAPARI